MYTNGHNNIRGGVRGGTTSWESHYRLWNFKTLITFKDNWNCQIRPDKSSIDVSHRAIIGLKYYIHTNHQ